MTAFTNSSPCKFQTTYLLAFCCLLLLSNSCLSLRLTQTKVQSSYSISKVTTPTSSTACITSWLQAQMNSLMKVLDKSRTLVNKAMAKATGPNFTQTRTTLSHALDQIYMASQLLDSLDYSKARKRVEFLRMDIITCQKLVAAAIPGTTWTELSQALSTTSPAPQQILRIMKSCKNSTQPTTPSMPKNSSPPPLTKASPPPPPEEEKDSTSEIDYTAHGLAPYGVNAGKWSKVIHASYYSNSLGNYTYGACYGNTPSGVTNQFLGVYNAAGSKVLLQAGAECGSCYQVRCAEPNICNPDSMVTVRLTNACPKSGGTGYPWCDFPRIHFDMSQVRFWLRVENTHANTLWDPKPSCIHSTHPCTISQYSMRLWFRPSEIIPLHPAFAAIANLKYNAVAVRYRRVDCPVVGDIAFHISSKGHRWWIPVNVLNVGGPGAVSAMWFRTSNTSDWVPFYRSWGANWSIHQRPYLVGKSVSFRMQMRGTEQYVVSENVLPVNWQFGETYVGGQFEADQSDIFLTADPSGSNDSSS